MMGTGVHEDLPNPDLDDLQQREPQNLITLPVRVEGPTTVHPLPARSGPMFAEPLSTTFAKVLGRDLKRSGAVLLCSDAWEISRSGNAGSGVPWPADVPLYVPHCDEVWARVVTETGTLSVVTGVWAD